MMVVEEGAVVEAFHLLEMEVVAVAYQALSLQSPLVVVAVAEVNTQDAEKLAQSL